MTLVLINAVQVQLNPRCTRSESNVSCRLANPRTWLACGLLPRPAMFVPTHVSPTPPQGSTRPATLIVLAIGVGRYQCSDLAPLSYAAKDARDFAAAMETLAVGVYPRCIIRVVVDEHATRHAILAELESLRSDATAGDLVVVFLAGHGVNQSGTDVYYFMPYDFIDGQCLATAVQGSMLCSELLRTQGRRLLIADTCNAGNILGDRLVKLRGHAPDPNEVFRSLCTRRSSGQAALLAASGTHQASIEGRQWDNGAFTWALLEGLRGSAIESGGSLTARGLGHYASRRVQELTRGAQVPLFASLGSDVDFSLHPELASEVAPGCDPLIGVAVGDYRIQQSREKTSQYTLYTLVLQLSEQPVGVLLRVLTSELSQQVARIARLQHALGVLGGVTHQNLARPLGWGHLPDGRFYVLLPARAGRPLSELLCEAENRLDARVLLLHVIRGLRELHRLKLLHLGLCPESIIVDPRTNAVVIEDAVTLCASADPECWSVHQRGSVGGQPPHERHHYQPPECSTTTSLPSEAADVYALGTLAYRLLQGQTPFQRPTLAALRSAQLDASVPLQSVDVQVPLQLTQVLQRAIAAIPAQRPSSHRIWLLAEAVARAAPPATPHPVKVERQPLLPAPHQLSAKAAGPHILWYWAAVGTLGLLAVLLLRLVVTAD